MMIYKANNSRPSGNLPPQRGGFTLIEVVMVVTIIAIAAAMVIPQLASSSSFIAQSAARLIVSDLTYAQNQAVAEQTTRKVIFDLVNNSYRLTDSSDTTISARWMSGGIYQIDFENDSRFAGVELTAVDFGGATTLTFNDIGAPSDGGTIDIIAGGTEYRITVTAFTGRISVDELAGG